MKKILFFSVALITLLSIYSCKNETFEQKGTPEYINEVNEWHQKRISRLKEETGWLNLVGLFWLKDGENKFGSAKDNDIIFPSGPEHIGSLFLKDSTVKINVLPGVSVLNNNKPVNEMILKDDHTEEPTILALGSLRWYIIKRVKGYAIRLRDLNARLLKTFRDIERFPVNVDWRIEAKFEKFDPPKKITIPDIIGTSEEENSPGAVVFRKDNQTYRMDALDAGGNRIWFIFADETSGNETYGAGRFLYTDKPDSNGIVILDFNRAYNPPCVFTRFATCPLPPKDNYLKLRITAGEKMWGEHH
ncbi:MAG: DUF1684 domain-containing protein [Ignavibacteriaceae bacterium]|nr:DUF1684 domain-containing protein [Ignavibacteriaceae bacterium]MCW8960062.1 DUF1684 domain-containing protein [Ignavibacteriaceae bacterium]